jgi:endo-1,4-beta-xylanase
MRNFLFLLIITSISFNFLHATYPDTTLRYFAEKRAKYVGTAINDSYFNFDTTNIYFKTINDNFNILVAENKMKMDALQPSNNVFNFIYADRLVDYAAKHGMKVRGHCLVWHNQIPKWITTGGFSKDSLIKILKNHITTVVSHFKGRVAEWDVVNEAISDGSGMRSSIWKDSIGISFIDSAFVWAHQADSSALLFYNDYSIESSTSNKAKTMLNLVKGLVSRGVPINGVGFQSHFSLNNINGNAISSNIDSLKKYGLLVDFTELDIRMTVNTATNSSFQNQAQNY